MSIEDKDNWHGKPLGAAASENIKVINFFYLIPPNRLQLHAKLTLYLSLIFKDTKTIIQMYVKSFQHLNSMIKNAGPTAIHPQKPLVDDAPAVNISNVKLSSPPSYKPDEQVATRLAYGTALAKV